MRPLWKDVLAAVWLGMILPGIVLNIFVMKDRYWNAQPSQVLRELGTGRDSRYISVLDPDGTRMQMELDRYLTGVLLAEMPAEFHREALKAQAVAARTYAWKAHTTGGKHLDGTVCTDSACCQAYITDEYYLSCGGNQENLEKVRRSVRITADTVLLYAGELIEATYFSSSNGSTEAALAVWGADYPYLQPVPSPEELSEHTVSYSPEEFQKLLEIRLSEDTDEWFGEVTYTEGGGVEFLEIGGDRYTGMELRSLLGLRSTDFQIKADQKEISITTRGYGHRVGMSQHGANAMAEEGSTWQQILQHYYPGTTLVPIP